MVRHFARLKLRLIRNGLKSPQYLILFTLGTVGASVLALFGFVFFASLRNEQFAGDATIVVFAAIALGWTIVPLLGFGTDETLDPQRLALLPLTRGQLLRGLLVAAVVGVAPVATAFAMSGAVIGLTHGVGEAVVIVAAVAATLLFCIVGSRTLIALLAPLLRSRRGRDIIVMLVVLTAFVPQSFRLFSNQGDHRSATEVFHQIATRVRFTPFGWGGLAASEAGEGHLAASLAALAAVVALTGGLLWIWSIAIPRAMTASDIAAPAERRKPGAAHSTLFPRWLGFLPRTRTGATAAKEVRYLVRDPRRRGPLIAALVVPALFLFESLRDAHSRPGVATMFALIALLPASGLAMNQFGLDGGALWVTLAAGVDPKSDLTGKNLATALFVVPLVAVPAVATAIVSNGWGYLPITLGLAPGMLGVVLAVGNFVSVHAPYALPDRKNPLASNPGQGCVAAIAAFGALAVDAIVLIPVFVVTSVALMSLPLPVATVGAVAFTTVYGGCVWRAGRSHAAGYIGPRMPELLDAVSERHAA